MSGVLDSLQGRVPELLEDLRALDHERENAARIYQKEQDERRNKQVQIRALLRLLGHEPQKGPSTRRQQKSSHVGPETLLAVLSTVEKQQEITFTSDAIHQALSPQWKFATTRLALAHLRDAEVIGRAGKDGKEYTYRILDRDAGAHLRQKLEEEIKHPAKGRHSTNGALENRMDAIVEAVRRLTPVTGPPSVREIGTELGYSPDFTRRMISLLQENGRIERDEPRRKGAFGKAAMTYAVKEEANAQEG